MKKKQFLANLLALIIVAMLFAGAAPSQAQQRKAKAVAAPLITVLNPAVESKMADRLPLSPRLDTLDGKTLYMVDINWGGPDAAYSVFEEIAAWFSQNMPSVKTVIKRKYGSYSNDDPALWKEIAKNGDAAMIGISGCDSCTSSVSQHAKTLEKMKIPTVGAAAANMIKYAVGYNFEYNHGMPVRFVGFPFPVAGQPKSVHHRYVFDSNDVLSGKPMMQAIIDALTKPLTEKEKYSGKPPNTVAEPRLLKPDTEENLLQLFKDKDWTDYNPIVLPTEARVAAMLKGTSQKPDKIVHKITWPAGNRILTVEKVAVCAVMAGARPEHLPLILALATYVPFGNSTSSMANMILVNGPIRNQVKMNYKGNVMGPHNEVNSVLGRSYTLLSKTAGDLHVGKTTFSGLGSTIQYNNLCIAENEEALPAGWDPVHVQMGFKPADNVLTVGTGWSYISSLGEVERHYPPQYLMRDYMRSLSGMGATVIMTSDVAVLLKDAQGFNTKYNLAKWLADNTEKTVASYWGNGVISTMFASMAIQGLEPYASQRKAPQESLIKPFQPRGIGVVVAGAGQTTWFVTDFGVGRGVLIDDWK
jgi:hypothetical protein